MDRKPLSKIMIGWPFYDQVTPGSAATAYNPVAGDSDLRYVTVPCGGSILTAVFNNLWATARNIFEAGQIDGFAMVHSDIAAEPGWLDVLHAELVAQDLDVIAAAAPIKDRRGLVSTAIDKGGDPWRVPRLTASEIAKLPETFGDAQVGGELLLNTGLWLCRLGPWMMETVFHNHDDIQRDPETNLWRAVVQSEDWDFSRQMRRAGLKLAATRKVPLKHAGRFDWDSREIWGELHDSANGAALPIAAAARDGFPADVAGWLTEEEGTALAILAQGRRVLEIGAYEGRSTICLARSATMMDTIDTGDGAGTPSPHPILGQLERNLGLYGVAEKVRVCIGRSAAVIPVLAGAGNRYDLIFIDGRHDHPAVLQDAELAAQVLAQGGQIAFHDYRIRPGEIDGRWDPGVTAAVQELLAAGWALTARHGTIAVLTPPPRVSIHETPTSAYAMSR